MISLKIVNKDGNVLKSNQHKTCVSLVYESAYAQGDKILLSSDLKNQYLMIALDDAIGECLVYCTEGQFEFEIPFDEKKVCYSPKAFSGLIHLITARCATKEEIFTYRNMCLNKYDTHTNQTCYPHACANVETRGESVFAAKNAINGNRENHSHGRWPYESWGINKDPNACIRVEFGREILAESVTLVLRADFPHDAWWEQVTIVFSSGNSYQLSLIKTDEPQSFTIPAQKVTWAELKNLKKAEDPSEFPALSQIEIYGKELER